MCSFHYRKRIATIRANESHDGLCLINNYNSLMSIHLRLISIENIQKIYHNLPHFLSLFRTMMRWCDCLHQSLGPIINYVNDLSRYGRTFWHFNFFLSFFNFMARKLIRLLRKKCVGNLIGKPALTFMSVCSFVINDFIRGSLKFKSAYF